MYRDQTLRPRLKTIFTPVLKTAQGFQLGPDGNAWEVEDPDNVLNQILQLMDGRRTTTEIAEQLALPKDIIEDVLHQFSSLGIIDKASEPHELENNVAARYRTNLCYFENYSGIDLSTAAIQKRLNGKKVCFLGLGGLSLTALSLVGFGVENIVGVDFDTIEESNLSRQFLYHQSDIGALKTATFEKRLRAANPRVNCTVIDRKITSATDLADVISGCDFVVNGIDQPPILSQRWINWACYKQNIPYVMEGVTGQRLVGQWYVPGKTACFECLLSFVLSDNENFAQHIKTITGTQFSARNPTTAAHADLIAGFLSLEIVKFLADLPMGWSIHDRLEFDTTNFEMLKIPVIEKNKACACCAQKSNSLEPPSLDELLNTSLMEPAA